MKTVLSVRDFAILYRIVEDRIQKMESNARIVWSYDYSKSKEEEDEIRKEQVDALQRNPVYQDLLRIREKLGELNIEIETPSVEVE